MIARSKESLNRQALDRVRQAHLKRLYRHQEFLRRLASKIELDKILPIEALQFLVADLRTAKKVAVAAKQRVMFDDYLCNQAPPSIDPHPPLPRASRPVHELSALNRSPVLPQLVAKVASVGCNEGSGILDELTRVIQAGATSYQLLDLLASYAISWENSARFLSYQHVVARPISESEITAARQARNFWNLFAEGRSRHAALVEAGKTSLFQGDWAYFDLAQFKALLPEITIPDHFTRSSYLVNNYDCADDYYTADVYAGNEAPLFKHPFWPPATDGRERRRLILARQSQNQFGG